MLCEVLAAKKGMLYVAAERFDPRRGLTGVHKVDLCEKNAKSFLKLPLIISSAWNTIVRQTQSKYFKKILRSVCIMANSSNNRVIVPEAREALNRFKMEAANEVGVNLKQGYNGDLTSKQAGSVGGQMVKKMIESYENSMK